MNTKIKILAVVFISFLQYQTANCQDYPYDIPTYNFIKYNSNKLHFFTDSSSFDRLYFKIDQLITFGKGQVNVLQIGASHTQADIFTGQLRSRLQTFYPGLNAGRGFVFPYRMINTNNPRNYYTQHSGNWLVCRNVEWNKTCSLGASGIAATTSDSAATLSIFLRNETSEKYDFNKVRIMMEPGANNYDVMVTNINVNASYIRNDSLGYIDIELDNYCTELHLKLQKSDSLQNKFTLFGINLNTPDPGFVINAFGVNGASLGSYLRCNFFIPQLKLMNPDWIIIALGINDGYTKNFNPEIYEQNYEQLIKNILEANPNVAITLVVPNDSYLYRKRPNTAIAKEQIVIEKLAAKYGCSMWSMYDVMGGYNSSVQWYNAGLMARDKVHFSPVGYNLLANLFFNAFLKSYDNHIEKNVVKLLNSK